MEQRQPRLGELIDDYCPRERRLANHVVVAMIGDEVKQVRCTTCDAEHPYKKARVPPRRKTPPAPGVLARPAAEPAAERPRLNGDGHPDTPEPALPAPQLVAAAPVAPPDPEPPGVDAPADDADAAPPVDEGPVHRKLLRATLPRIEGEVKERPIPEFTMRMARPARGGFRQGQGGRPGGFGGNRGGRRSPEDFRPGVMQTWSATPPRSRGGNVNGNVDGNRAPQSSRPPGGHRPHHKKSR